MAEFDSKKYFDSLIYSSMKETGFIIPETIDDVFFIEDELEKKSLPLPTEISDPCLFLNMITKNEKLVKKKEPINNNDIIAHAARNGDIISDSVRNKMNKDRSKSENK